MSSKKLVKTRIKAAENAQVRKILNDFCQKKFSGNVRQLARWLGTSDVNVHQWLDDTTVPGWVLLRIRDDAPEFLVADPTAPWGTIPVIGYVSAGETDIEYDDQGYPFGEGRDTIKRPPSVKDPHAYALKVKGDSMEDSYREGDTIILDTTKPVYNKDDAVVRVKGKSYLKIFWQVGDEVILRSFNKEHPEIRCKPEDIKFKHKVVLVEPK